MRPLRVTCAVCKWTPMVKVYTLETAQDVLQGHHDSHRRRVREVVILSDHRGTITTDVPEFTPPAMALDHYPATPDHPPASWWARVWPWGRR